MQVIMNRKKDTKNFVVFENKEKGVEFNTLYVQKDALPHDGKTVEKISVTVVILDDE